VFSVPPWWKNGGNTHHRDTENAEDAQRSELGQLFPNRILSMAQVNIETYRQLKKRRARTGSPSIGSYKTEVGQ